MPRIIPIFGIFLAAILVFAQPALARDADYDGSPPVSDEVLAQSFGTGSWLLSVANFNDLSDSENVEYLRWVGSNARAQMDVWWGSTGAELIAQSVRAATLGS